MRIYSDDGKEFKSVDECNAYEADLNLKALREQEENATKEKKRKELKKEIDKLAEEISDKIRDYQKIDNNNLKVLISNGKLVVKELNRTSIDDAFNALYGWF